MNAKKFNEKAFGILSSLLCTMLVSIVAVISLREVSNNFLNLNKLKQNIEAKFNLNDFDIKDCNSKQIHSGLLIKSCKNKNLVIIQK